MLQTQAKKIKFYAAALFLPLLLFAGVNFAHADAAGEATLRKDYLDCKDIDSNDGFLQQQCTQIFNTINQIYLESPTLPVAIDCTGANPKVCTFLSNRPGTYKVSGTPAASTGGVDGAACGGGTSCNTGLNCVSGKCRVPCTLDSDCGNTNQFCDLSVANGVCSAKTSPGQTGGITGGAAGGTSGPGSVPAGPGGKCPDGLSQADGGLCLPAAQFNSGLAATKNLPDLLVNIVKILLWFAGTVAVVMLVVGGFWYMTAGGNEEQSEKGKKTILNFVLGLAVILLAYALVTIISDLLTNSTYIG